MKLSRLQLGVVLSAATGAAVATQHIRRRSNGDATAAAPRKGPGDISDRFLAEVIRAARETHRDLVVACTNNSKLTYVLVLCYSIPFLQISCHILYIRRLFGCQRSLRRLKWLLHRAVLIRSAHQVQLNTHTHTRCRHLISSFSALAPIISRS